MAHEYLEELKRLEQARALARLSREAPGVMNMEAVLEHFQKAVAGVMPCPPTRAEDRAGIEARIRGFRDAEDRALFLERVWNNLVEKWGMDEAVKRLMAENEEPKRHVHKSENFRYDLMMTVADERPAAETPMEKRVDEMAQDILNGNVAAPGRRVLRDALDRKEAPLTGKAKGNEALGRISRG